MSTNRSRRIDRDTAEQLLVGSGAGAAPGHDALAGLLAAVSAPADDEELPGEQAAMAAFRSARLGPVSTPVSDAVSPVSTLRKRNVLTPARLLGAKVAAAVAAAALGGVAVAAGTGHLPAALGGGPASSAPAPTVSAPALKAGEPTSRTLAGSPEEVPADLAELCRAHAADGGGAQPSGVLAESRFAPLVAAAGGPAGVPAYCAPVVGGPDETPGGSPTPRPTDGKRGASPKPGKSDKPEATKRPEDPKPTRSPGGRTPGKPDAGPTLPPPRDDAPTTRHTP
ncbi:hypothetical protein OG625_20840 [Streptomyces sp. NBC_01351]|uniref:hypothetical protein n=1 Tax=Streptomyces sp. NBC_01351 TaxID=2903833 RepID=UPI002E34BC10|nr:hypothetical protein [Streptomyces sp. NBC_01351]